MWRRLFSAISLFALFIIAGCADDAPDAAREYAILSTDTTMRSRGVEVPVTLVVPEGAEGERFPLVVIAHGHGGSRWEGGAFPMLAESLAKTGIASVRVDFPGCGDSTEPFTKNNLSNMLLDLQVARAYAVANAPVDDDRVGLLGYSMGARVVTLLSEIDPSYKAMAIWAPAVTNGAMRNVTEFGGQHSYEMLKLTAEDTGVAEYTTRWGTNLQLGYRWFEDMERSMPLDAIAKYEGPLLVLYGDADEVVPAAIPKSAIAAATSSSEVVEVAIPTARHGLGFYTERPEIAAQVIAATTEFLDQRL